MQSRLASPTSTLLTIPQAARRLGVSAEVVRAWTDSRLLAATHLTNGALRITAAELAVARRALGFPD